MYLKAWEGDGAFQLQTLDASRWRVESERPLRIVQHGLSLPEADRSVVEISDAGELTVKRGCSGEQPVYVHRAGETIQVSDRVREIVVEPPSVDIEACYQFIYFEYPWRERTLHAGIVEVLNGEALTFKAGVAGTARQDGFSLPSEETAGDPKHLASHLRQHIAHAHACRIGRSNGVLLSGGIDSQVMAVTLLRDLNLQDTFGVTFSVAGAAEDESNDARRVAQQLQMEWVHVQVDPAREVDWSAITVANNPYIGAIAMRAVLDRLGPESGGVLFAGQDTRLHTPAVGMRDRLLWQLYRLPGAGKAAAQVGQLARRTTAKSAPWSFAHRVAELFAHSPTLEDFLAHRYFHMRRVAFNDGDPAMHRGLSQLAGELRGVSAEAPRALYNRVVAANWRRQYLFDIGHMVDSCLTGGRQAALPFYDYGLASFSARLPFRMAAKTTAGRAGHSSKRVKVNKYLLRMAYERDLDRDLIFRDKAVCKTNYLFFNGALRGLLNEFGHDMTLDEHEWARVLHLPELQRLSKQRDGAWTVADNWLCNIIFNALVAWSMMRKTQAIAVTA